MKTLKKFEFKTQGARGNYDWDKLLDGGIYEMTAGEDFQCTPGNFRFQARNAAKKRGKGLKASKTETGVVIQAVENGEAEG